MVADRAAERDAVFLDTRLVVAAPVEVHPSHAVSSAFIDGVLASDAQLHVSPQVCREFLIVLTRRLVSGRTFHLDEALAAG